MTKKTLDDRRQALEEIFFQKENEKVLADLRAEREQKSHREALASVMAIGDTDVLDQLVSAGIRAETWLAITLVPLIEVAWADREMSADERVAILKAADEFGIDRDSDARRLIDSWLDHRPTSDVLAAWEAYIEAVYRVLGDAARGALRTQTLDAARRVAEATGGFLGIGNTVSEAEGKMLDELARVF